MLSVAYYTYIKTYALELVVGMGMSDTNSSFTHFHPSSVFTDAM